MGKIKKLFRGLLSSALALATVIACMPINANAAAVTGSSLKYCSANNRWELEDGGGGHYALAVGDVLTKIDAMTTLTFDPKGTEKAYTNTSPIPVGNGNSVADLTVVKIVGTTIYLCSSHADQGDGTCATCGQAYGTPAALTGTVTITGNTKYNNTLTANVTGDNNTGTLSYQWKSNGTNVGTDSQWYLPQVSDIGNTITVTVTSSVQTGSIVSSATAIIEKEDGPAAPSVIAVACTTAAEIDGKITGTTTDMEYSVSNTFSSATDCSATETTGLRPNTFYVRIKETATHKAGAAAQVYVGNYVAPTTYTVTFYVSGHGTAPTAVTGLTSGSTVTKPTDPSATGYTFMGWYKENTFANKWYFASDTVTGNTELFAKWHEWCQATTTMSSITLEDDNMGYFEAEDVTTSSPVYIGNCYVVYAKTVFGNYEVATYDAGSDCFISNDEMSFNDIKTLTATNDVYVVGSITEPLGPTPTYTVTFNANGGTGTHAAATGIYGSYILPTTTTFVAPSGKVFDGWSETLGGTKFIQSNIYIVSPTTLYAVWKDATPTPTPTPTPSTPSSDSSPSVSTPSSETKTEVVPTAYAVVKGDSLSKIAKKNGLTLKELLAMNPQIKNPNKIRVGQAIIIGTTTKTTTSDNSTKAPTVPTNEYTVVKGDSLSKIAKRLGISLKALVALNPQIADINKIHIGQKINLQ